MRRITREDLTIEDETGERYPPRRILAGLVNTILLTLFLIAILFCIAILWQALH